MGEAAAAGHLIMLTMNWLRYDRNQLKSTAESRALQDFCLPVMQIYANIGNQWLEIVRIPTPLTPSDQMGFNWLTSK